MLSDRLYREISLYTKFASYFGIVPFGWCSKTLTIIPSKRAAKRALMNLQLQCVWCVFGVIQVVRFYIQKDYKQLNTSMMHFFARFVCLEAISIFAFQPDGCMNLGNAVFFYLKHINRK